MHSPRTSGDGSPRRLEIWQSHRRVSLPPSRCYVAGQKVRPIGRFAILHIEGDARSAGDQWGQLIARMQDPSRPLTLRVANRLFGEQTFVFEQPYLEWTNSAFGAALEPVSFLTDAQASRNHI